MNSIHIRAVKGLSARNRRVVSAQIHVHGILLLALGLAVVSVGRSVGWAAEADSGGDKIQFSGAGDAVRIPEPEEARDRASDSLEALDRGNSLGGALGRTGGLLPMPAPRQVLSSRLLGQSDREKNWILNRPEDMTRLPTAEEVMQIWEYDLNRALGEYGVTGDSMRKRPAKPQATPSALNPDQSDSAVVLDYRLDGRIQSLGGAQTGGWLGEGSASPSTFTTPLPLTQSQSAAETRADSLGSRTSNPFSVLAGGQVTSELQGLLATPTPLGPLGTGLDPISMDLDSTRREINPITSPSLGDLGSAQGFDTAASSSTSGPRGSLLEEMTAKILGPSSLSPAVAVPTEPTKSTPRPNSREPFGRKL